MGFEQNIMTMVMEKARPMILAQVEALKVKMLAALGTSAINSIAGIVDGAEQISRENLPASVTDALGQVAKIGRSIEKVGQDGLPPGILNALAQVVKGARWAGFTAQPVPAPQEVTS